MPVQEAALDQFRVFYTTEVFFNRDVFVPVSAAKTAADAIAVAVTTKEQEPGDVAGWNLSTFTVNENYGWDVDEHHDDKGNVNGWNVVKVGKAFYNHEGVPVEAIDEADARSKAENIVVPIEFQKDGINGWRIDSCMPFEDGECERCDKQTIQASI